MRRDPACHKRGSHRVRAIGLVVGAVASLTLGTAARAEDGMFDTALTKLGLKTNPGAAPDFVQKTRPGETDYIGIGIQHPVRPIKPKTLPQVKSMEADLDAAGARNQGLAKSMAYVPAKPATSAPKLRHAAPATKN